MFHIELRLQGDACQRIESHVDPVQIRDRLDLFIVACELLEQTNCLEFQVEGFGDTRANGGWFVQVSDLSTVIEDIGEAVEKLSSGRPAEIYFYEQAHQRKVFLVPKDSGQIELICESETASWSPSPSRYTATLSDVRNTLAEVVCAFCKALLGNLPQFVEAPVFREWVQQSGQRIALEECCPEVLGQV